VSASINASVFQGSAVGPPLFVVNGTDLRPIHNLNFLDKFADDTYLIVPACNDHTIASELQSIERWSNLNNLKLNKDKSQELIIFSSKRKNVNTVVASPNIERVDSLKMLGVTFDSNLSVSTHVSNVCQTAAQSLYAVKLLSSKGLNSVSSRDVCCATVVSRLVYASPAWWGYTTAEDRQRLQAILNRAVRWGYYGKDDPTVEQICNKRDRDLFTKVIRNPVHVLHHLLPPARNTPYNLRALGHQFTLPDKRSPFTDKNFFCRLLYQNNA